MTLRSLALATTSLTLIHCAAPDAELDAGAQYDAWMSELAHGQAAPPIDMDWYVPPMILGETIEVTVTGGPANRAIVFVASSDTTSPGACPAAIAPECMGVPSPFAVLARGTTDASGAHTFTLRVPPNLSFPEVRVQAVSKAGPDVYLTGAPAIDILPPPTDFLINDIRTGLATEGDLVRTQGIVTATTFRGYFIQDPLETSFGGIYVYDGGITTKPSVGDDVTVVGTYEEFAGTTPADSLAEVVVSGPGHTILSSGNAVPAPISVSPATWASPGTLEGLESMLVDLAGAGPLTIQTDLGFGEYGLSDGGADEAVIDDLIYRYETEIPTWSVGDAVDSVSGVLNYSFGAYKVEPLDAASIINYQDLATPPAP